MNSIYTPATGFKGKLQQVRQFGFWSTLRASIILFFSRWFEFEICRVAGSDNVSEYPCPQGFHMLVADAAEFARWADQATVQEHQRAFDQGDYCVITLKDNLLVGYNFYSSASTPVTASVAFRISSAYCYSYGAYTHPDYRGLKLSPARWTFARNWRIEQGINQPTIFYIALNNLPSLSSGNNENTLIGYSGYLRRPGNSGKVYCFNSRGCRRQGVGFYPC